MSFSLKHAQHSTRQLTHFCHSLTPIIVLQKHKLKGSAPACLPAFLPSLPPFRLPDPAGCGGGGRLPACPVCAAVRGAGRGARRERGPGRLRRRVLLPPPGQRGAAAADQARQPGFCVAARQRGAGLPPRRRPEPAAGGQGGGGQILDVRVGRGGRGGRSRGRGGCSRGGGGWRRGAAVVLWAAR